jgi:hypothetical protein
MLCALGLGDDLAGVTQEDDYPEAARDLPPVTRERFAPGRSATEIDAAQKARSLAGELDPPFAAEHRTPARALPLIFP